VKVAVLDAHTRIDVEIINRVVEGEQTQIGDIMTIDRPLV
jgi:hypothetical protein